MTTAALQQNLERLRQDYAQALPARLSACRHAWRAFTRGDHDAGTELLRHLHKLAGSAASFGFRSLGLAARTGENALHALLLAPAGDLALYQAASASLDALLQHPITPTSATPSLEVGHAVTADSPLIYLCEDDLLLAAQIAMQLTNFGYRVVTFNQPQDMQSGMSQIVPAAILMDVGFPQDDLAGPSVIATLRRTTTAPLPPVCFISARSDFDARLAAVRCGCDGYFVKPIDINAMVEQLDILTARVLTDPYRVLIIDDDASTAGHYSARLQTYSMITAEAHSPTAALQALADFQPDVILMAMHLRPCDGNELAQVIRQTEAFLDVPILYLATETMPPRANQRALSDDYLPRHPREAELVALIRYRAERYRGLHRLIRRDSLTGLLNHAAIHEAVERQLAQAGRHRRTFAVAIIDIDHFKRVNDSHGHPVGDQVLKSLSRLLHQRLRRSDVIGRYGGEEFVILFDEADAVLAASVLNKIRELFGTMPHASGSGDFTVQFSAGIADFPRFTTTEALIKAADQALYLAKAEGRNRIIVGERTH